MGDVGGNPDTEHYEVYGPVMILLTTTSPEVFDEETHSRFVQLPMDESHAQTRDPGAAAALV